MTLFLPAVEESLSIPTPLELMEEFAPNGEDRAFILRSRKIIKDIIHGKDKRLLLVVGPCSIHDVDSTLEYAEKLQGLSQKLKGSFFVVMRSYFEKPRTKGGWKGLVYDPFLDGSNDMVSGLKIVRELLLKLTKMRIPLGSELLNRNTEAYFSDLLSWGCVGARTVTSQPHRELASHMPFAIGFKNTVSGAVDCAINGILSANASHTFLGIDEMGQLSQIQSKGNSDCHLILRGGDRPNYDSESVKAAIEKCVKAKVLTKLMVDCSHGNCGKNPLKQIDVFKEVIRQKKEGAAISGVMLESHLHGGSQTISADLRYGISVTDPCLDWSETHALLSQFA